MSGLLNDELNLNLLECICSGKGVEVNISELSKILKKHRNTISNKLKELFGHNIINKPRSVVSRADILKNDPLDAKRTIIIPVIPVTVLR